MMMAGSTGDCAMTTEAASQTDHGPGPQPPACVAITLNGGERVLQVAPGRSLLATLVDEHIYMPSACGGNGICGTCKCKVEEGGDAPHPAEDRLVTKPELAQGIRLACQAQVHANTRARIAPEVFAARRWSCTVVSNRNVATYIKELVLALPPGETLRFRPGEYVQIDIPAYHIRFTDFDLPPDFRADWDKAGFLALAPENAKPTSRAYSMANHPAEGNQVRLNVRVATPLAANAPAGVASSFLFSLRPGDSVTVSGPHGDFLVKDTDREMVYIGGGAGMAPLRSHLFHLFHTLGTSRKVGFWYGARSRRELFYEADFQAIASQRANFTFTAALSEPQPEDQWLGPVGFIHQVVLDQHLASHPDPTSVEYYLCGPPMMIRASQKMLAKLGVQPDMIAFDAF